MGVILRFRLGMLAAALLSSAALADEPAKARKAVGGGYSIIDAVKQAVNSNPGVTEAAANRRATEAELRQNQGSLLPQVRLQAEYGPEKLTRHDIVPPPAGDGQWRKDSREGSIIIRQLLFDGFTSLNEIWRQIRPCRCCCGARPRTNRTDRSRCGRVLYRYGSVSPADSAGGRERRCAPLHCRRCQATLRWRPVRRRRLPAIAGASGEAHKPFWPSSNLNSTRPAPSIAEE